MVSSTGRSQVDDWTGNVPGLWQASRGENAKIVRRMFLNVKDGMEHILLREVRQCWR